MNECREGFCRRVRLRSFHVDGPKSEKPCQCRADLVLTVIIVSEQMVDLPVAAQHRRIACC